MRPANFLRAAALLGLILAGPAAVAETVWFEVAGDSSRESFLLPIDDPALIDAARARLDLGEQSGIGGVVVATIRAGGDGLNRNLRNDGRLWSWHVTELIEFADLAIEICDGSPQLVEDDPQWFIDNTGARICFWGYSVAAELPEPPSIALTDILDGFWHPRGAPGTGYLVDVFEQQQVLAVAWLGFDGDGSQLWRVGAGEIVDSAVGPVPMHAAAPDAVDQLLIGFDDCNSAWVRSLGDDDELGPVVMLERTVPKFDCGPR